MAGCFVVRMRVRLLRSLLVVHNDVRSASPRPSPYKRDCKGEELLEPSFRLRARSLIGWLSLCHSQLHADLILRNAAPVAAVDRRPSINHRLCPNLALQPFMSTTTCMTNAALTRDGCSNKQKAQQWLGEGEASSSSQDR